MTQDANMNKTLVLFLVATLLLAGCTELTESEDGETLKIEVNEDIAIEKIADFITVDEGESFGITMMYDMDPSMMGLDEGMLEVDEDSEAVITIEMTQAWSPNGYHTSEVMGLVDSGAAIKYVTSVTHIDTTLYFEMGYETVGDMCADEETAEDTEMCEMMFGEMPAPQSYSMATTTTHTEVIAAMAEETSSNSDDMDPLEMLEFFTFVECFGTFTPADSVDGLQIFDVAMEGMDDDSISPMMALCISDSDESGGVSFEEFIVVDETDQEDMATMQSKFSDADTNSDDELTLDELGAFIEAVDAHYEGMDNGDDGEDGLEDDGPDGMPNMAVAFNSAGEIEYFEMQMDEMGDELTMMKIYVLTDDKVNSLFTNVDAGELVALPFDIVDYMPFGSNEEFMCDDGSTIPMDYVNDGYDDCDGGEDEMDDSSGGSGDSIEAFLTDNWAASDETYTSPEFTVYTGFDLIESVVFTLTDSDGTELTSWTIGTSDFTDMPNNGMLYYVSLMDISVGDECYTLTATVTDIDDYILEWSRDDICFDRTESTDDSYIDEMVEQWMEFMDADGDGSITWDEHDAFISSDEGWESDDVRNDSMMTWSDYDIDSNGGLDVDELFELLVMLSESEYDDDGDGGEGPPSPQELLDMTDTDSNGAMTMDEFNAYMNQDGETMPQEMIDEFNAIFDEADTDDSGDLDINELEQFITAIDNYMMSMEDSEETFTCDDGETIPLDYVDDGEEDCSDGSDESNMDDDHGDGHDHSDDSDEIVMYITSEMDFHFEGDMSDYKIELATCEDDYDMDTDELTTTCETVMSVAINDADADSSIMFHDADSSGTISVGDMIHIGDVEQDWNDVRLYSISADAYSDENPMHNAPGFTGLVGMLALLGAAFIRRNE